MKPKKYFMEPSDAEDPQWLEPNEVPFNMTAMGAYVVISGRPNSFEKRKKRK